MNYFEEKVIGALKNIFESFANSIFTSLTASVGGVIVLILILFFFWGTTWLTALIVVGGAIFAPACIDKYLLKSYNSVAKKGGVAKKIITRKIATIDTLKIKKSISKKTKKVNKSIRKIAKKIGAEKQLENILVASGLIPPKKNLFQKIGDIWLFVPKQIIATLAILYLIWHYCFNKQKGSRLGGGAGIKSKPLSTELGGPSPLKQGQKLPSVAPAWVGPANPIIIGVKQREDLTSSDDLFLYSEMIGIPRKDRLRFVLGVQGLEEKILAKKLPPGALEAFLDARGQLLLPGEEQFENSTMSFLVDHLMAEKKRARNFQKLKKIFQKNQHVRQKKAQRKKKKSPNKNIGDAAPKKNKQKAAKEIREKAEQAEKARSAEKQHLKAGRAKKKEDARLKNQDARSKKRKNHLLKARVARAKKQINKNILDIGQARQEAEAKNRDGAGHGAGHGGSGGQKRDDGIFWKDKKGTREDNDPPSEFLRQPLAEAARLLAKRGTRTLADQAFVASAKPMLQKVLAQDLYIASIEAMAKKSAPVIQASRQVLIDKGGSLLSGVASGTQKFGGGASSYACQIFEARDALKASNAVLGQASKRGMKLAEKELLKQAQEQCAENFLSQTAEWALKNKQAKKMFARKMASLAGKETRNLAFANGLQKVAGGAALGMGADYLFSAGGTIIGAMWSGNKALDEAEQRCRSRSRQEKSFQSSFENGLDRISTLGGEIYKDAPPVVDVVKRSIGSTIGATIGMAAGPLGGFVGGVLGGYLSSFF